MRATMEPIVVFGFQCGGRHPPPVCGFLRLTFFVEAVMVCSARQRGQGDTRGMHVHGASDGGNLGGRRPLPLPLLSTRVVLRTQREGTGSKHMQPPQWPLRTRLRRRKGGRRRVSAWIRWAAPANTPPAPALPPPPPPLTRDDGDAEQQVQEEEDVGHCGGGGTWRVCPRAAQEWQQQ